MKTLVSLLFVSCALWTLPVSAQLLIPEANGHDLDFAPVASVEVDLSLAEPGDWDSTNHTAGNGVYDAEKWVIVFKYNSVTIPAGVTVTFKNHPSRAPVIWLVGGTAPGAGGVQIIGDVVLDGGDAVDAPFVAEPGPGGFRGGKGLGRGENWGSGFGPGGGRPGNGTATNSHAQGSGAGHSTAGDAGGNPGGIAYGNPGLIPLIGGSGGGGSGHGSVHNLSGSAGGGAMLIAATHTVTVDGTVSADGGTSSVRGGGGSGGGIRILCDALAGSGTLRAAGGSTSIGNLPGAYGRIRLQANSTSGTLSIDPVVAVEAPTAVVIVPGSTDPVVRITKIAGVSVPTEPAARINFPGADINYNAGSSIQVEIETQNIETTADVCLRVAAKSGDEIVVDAMHSTGDMTLSTWIATVDTADGYGVMQVHVVRPTP